MAHRNANPKGGPEAAGGDAVQRHATALDAVHSALLTLLATPEATPDSVANELFTLSMQHRSESKELLERVLGKAAVDMLKGGIREPSHPNSVFLTALSIVDVSIALVRLRRVDDRFPCKLLEIVFTFCTRGQLAAGVAAIRDRFAAYRAATPANVVYLYLIKAAMSCINRDQKGSDPVLAGRLRLMLAAALPVWHPSGMNKRAQFNAGNEIDYESALKEGDCKGLDVALYKAFWGLQTFMRNPPLAESEASWNEARKGMDTVLAAFETLPCPADSPRVLENANPKYMTAPSILRLQLVDIRVRRHVLVQYAIFLHHLQVVGDAPRTENNPPATLIKADFCKSLFENGGEGERTKVRVYKLLERDSAGKFKRFVLSLLQREKRWIDWKKRGYKHLNEVGHEAPATFKRRAVLSPIPTASGPALKRRRQQANGGDWRQRQASWKMLPPAERMMPLKDPHRSPVLTVEMLKDQLREDMNDPDVTEDVKRKNDTKYVWRSLRMLCEESLETLEQVIDVKSKGGYDLERCVKGEAKTEPNLAKETVPAAAGSK